MSRLEFYTFSLMPYPFVPPGEEIESTWVTLSNRHYDPRIGHRLYREYLEQMVFAEQLGYDGVLVNEHHQNAYAVQLAPNLWAAYLCAKTERIRIGILGNALPLHRNPLRVAEEVAMLDVLSGGRIISGHVRAMGAEYVSSGVDPTTSKERFWEAHELIIKAWTEDGPFTWQGDHFNVQYVNPWPKPLQQPHPPVWIPGSTSLDTIEECAKRRIAYMLTPTSQWLAKRAFAMYYEVAEEKCGYTPAPTQLGRLVHTHVAETDEQAHREARPHVMWFFRNGLKIPRHHLFPPGYNSAASMLRTLQGQAKAGAKPFWDMTYEELVEHGFVIVGSPDTVIEKYAEMVEQYRIGMVMSAGGHIGSMPHWLVLKNMQLFAEEVIPHFREPDGKPVWAKEERAAPRTEAERSATVPKPPLQPKVRVDGDRYLDARTGYISEVLEETDALSKERP